MDPWPEITQEAQEEPVLNPQIKSPQPQDMRSQSKISIPNYKEIVALNKNQQTKTSKGTRNPKFQVKEKLRETNQNIQNNETYTK